MLRMCSFVQLHLPPGRVTTLTTSSVASALVCSSSLRAARKAEPARARDNDGWCDHGAAMTTPWLATCNRAATGADTRDEMLVTLKCFSRVAYGAVSSEPDARAQLPDCRCEIPALAVVVAVTHTHTGQNAASAVVELCVWLLCV